MKISFVRPIGTVPQTPAAVQGVVATVISSTEIDLTWTPIAGAQNYTVRIFGNPVVTLPSTAAQFTMLAPQTQYSFTVSAINNFGEGPQSTAVLATTQAALQPPDKVTGLVANPVSTSEIDLTWNTAARATNYIVQRNNINISTVTGLSFNDTGLTQATQYQYNIVANNNAGNGLISNPAFASTFAAQTGGLVKWFPGHYVESNTVIGVGGGLATVQGEIDRITNLPNIKGYMILVYWGFLQQSANTYTFTALDQIVAYIKSKNKRWCLQVVAGIFNYGANPPTKASAGPVPAYINNGNTSQWGTAGTRANGVTTVLSGQSGWWGGDGNGHTYGAALWRPNVMSEWVKLHQAIGAKYDSDPSFELIYQGEDSFYQGTGSTNNSDYNDTTQLNGWKSWLQSCCGAFPTTNVGFSETFLQFQQNSIALVNYLTTASFPNHPPLMGQTDSLGAVQRNAIHTWGSQTYAGLLGTLGDKRPTNCFIAEIQAPDQGFYQNLGSPREDVKAGLDIMKCTHSFWAIVVSPTAQNTLPNKYPCTFTVNVTGTSGTLTVPWPLNTGQYDLITTPGGRGNFTKGSKAVTFTVAQTSTTPTISVKYPLIPSNWANGGTSTATQNGTSTSYTDAGLLAWINDPANALQNAGYPTNYPTS